MLGCLRRAIFEVSDPAVSLSFPARYPTIGSVQHGDEHDVCSLPTSSSICEEVSGRGSMLLVHAYDVAFLAWSLFCTESTVVSVMCSISFSADLHAQP